MTTSKGKAQSKRLKSLKQGRPPLLKTQTKSLSSKATRSLIRSHHTLHKAYAKAVKDGDAARVRALQAEISARGDLRSYQFASALGQSAERGGDSSRVLVEWLKPTFEHAEASQTRLRMLEVGALSTKNACSRIHCLDVTRIDLHSQELGIREIDFMELPVPSELDAKFDVVSLSLVLNYVPDAAGRGDMLRRVSSHLRPASDRQSSDELLPCLFLVLPLPCIINSRYLTEARLKDLMHSLGYALLRIKKTSKLYYTLWVLDMDAIPRESILKKEELQSGKARNNFAIVLS